VKGDNLIELFAANIIGRDLHTVRGPKAGTGKCHVQSAAMIAAECTAPHSESANAIRAHVAQSHHGVTFEAPRFSLSTSLLHNDVAGVSATQLRVYVGRNSPPLYMRDARSSYVGPQAEFTDTMQSIFAHGHFSTHGATTPLQRRG
jgi:hypothetical protein